MFSGFAGSKTEPLRHNSVFWWSYAQENPPKWPSKIPQLAQENSPIPERMTQENVPLFNFGA